MSTKRDKKKTETMLLLVSNVHIIRASVWSLVRQFSRRRSAVHATWSIASSMTCWCRPEQIMQQSGAAEVRILTEIYTNFMFLGVIS